MKIIKNYLYNVSYQVLVLIIPIVTLPYISRVLGPTGVGIYTYTNSIVSYFILFGNLGISIYGNRQIAYVQSDKYQRSKVFFEIFILKILTTTCAILLFIVFLCSYTDYRLFMVAQTITLVASMFDISWYFMGVEDFKKNIIRSTAIKVISLILIFIYVRSSDDLFLYILIMGSSVLLGNIILLPFLKNEIQGISLSVLNIQQHLLPSMGLFLPQVATQIYLVVNRTMLGKLASIQTVGYFSSADTLVRLALTIVSALSAVLMPRIANLIANNDNDSVTNYMSKSFQFINFLAMPIMFGLMAISHKFVPLFLGEQFGIVGTLIFIEAPVTLLISWSIAITNQYLIPSKMTKSYTVSTIIGAVVNIGLNPFLISYYSVYGAIVATVVSEIMVAIYLMFCIRKFIGIRSLFVDFHKYSMSGIIMFFTVLALDIYLPNRIMFVIFEVGIGIASYIAILYILKPKLVNNWRTFFDD